MQRTWKQILCYTGLSAALSFGPVLAQAESPQRPAVTADTQRLEELDRQIKDLKGSMTTATRFLENVEKDLKDFQRETQLATSSSDTKIQGLTSDLANLKIEVENLRARMTTPTRISGFGPRDTAATATGRVELVNVYPQEVSVVVNNRAYRLLPNEIRLTDPVPAGAFTYEVLGVTEKRTRELAADRVYPIYIHQQQ